MWNVGKASVVNLRLLFTVNYTWERNHIIVRSVGGPSVRPLIFRTIRESTLGRSHSNVMHVGRASAGIHIFSPIRESIQERNLTNVRSVGRASSGA